jgi:hypothetical protein
MWRKPTVVIGVTGFLLVMALGAYALGLGRDGPSQQEPRSGIRGIVEYYGCADSAVGPCVLRPTSATVIVRRDSDSTIARRFRSQPDGSFRIPLHPGRYRLESGPFEEVPGQLAERHIIVPRNRYIDLRIVFTSSEA